MLKHTIRKAMRFETKSSQSFVLNVLALDRPPFLFESYRKQLKSQGFELRVLPVFTEIKALTGLFRPDLILINGTTDGKKVIQKVNAIKSQGDLKNLPVVIVAGRRFLSRFDQISRWKGVDFLVYPFSQIELLTRLKVQFNSICLKYENEKRRNYLGNSIYKKIEEVRRVKEATIFALAKLAESRDPETGSHLERIREYAYLIAKSLSPKAPFQNTIDRTFIRNLYNMSPLHDIGKVGIPDAILLKKGKLNKSEFNVMKTHTVIGSEALEDISRLNKNSSFLVMAKEIALYHHEAWDGSGYPHGLKGEQIPLASRIIALADVYDALRCKRVYKPRFSRKKTEGVMKQARGQLFDPDIYDTFYGLRDEFDRIALSYPE